MKPTLLYIEPPEINGLPVHERRSVALFCLEAAQYQLRHKKHFVLVHPVDSTFGTIPQASVLCEQSLGVLGAHGSFPHDEHYE